jgi:dTDP-glucose pyrophosphorylase
VILAGGKGTRMQPFSDSLPKPLLPICNKPIIQYQIEALRDLGIRDIFILIGHKGYEIVRTLGDGSRFGVNLIYVEQKATLGIAHAVRQLEDHVDRPFLLFLGDIFFKAGDLNTMFDLLEEQNGGAVLATREEPDPAAIRKNYAIVLNEHGFATRVIEKPRHTVNRLKGVGIYLFDLCVFDAIRRTPRTAMRDEYEITDSIQVLIQDGLPVRPCNSVIEDINLTTPADILRCNLMHAAETAAFGGHANLRAHSGARLQNCVVGRDVSVRHGITIRNSVIFDRADIDVRSDLENFVITPEFMVDCNHAMR